MKEEKKITQWYCDVCKKEVEKPNTAVVPVRFLTEQTEGRSCDPYVRNEKLDFCEGCFDKILVLNAVGAQGYNDYSFRVRRDCLLKK